MMRAPRISTSQGPKSRAMLFENGSLLGFSVSLLFGVLLAAEIQADALDEAVLEDTLLRPLLESLAAYDIDVATNLNSRELIAQRIQRPRLGRFPDLPIDTLPQSEEIESWETAYRAMEIGAIALLRDSGKIVGEDPGSFLMNWLDASSDSRVFISFYKQDQQFAEKINGVAAAQGLDTLLLMNEQIQGHENDIAGHLYATAAQRLAIDTRAARRYKTEVTELSYLGKRVRRKSNSLFKDDNNSGGRNLARREPSVFLKESLGDEFTESTILEIVVPGGVALGETARLDLDVSSMRFEDGVLFLSSDNESIWLLPSMELPGLKALFDFVERSESIHSDSTVDIDEQGRVSLSSALRDTDVGYNIMHADTQPFDYVRNLPVIKSVMIDIGVHWFEQSQSLRFETDYELRFLSANNMRFAQTTVALEYKYDSVSAESEYQDAWGRDVGRLHENLDYAGLGQSMAEVANYAGWIGLFRKLHEDRVPFLHGRYEFMKINKLGRNTPSRYR